MCCKVSPSTVTNLGEKYGTGSMNKRNDRRTKAPRKTTPKQDRAFVRASECGRFKAAPQHRRDLIPEGTRLCIKDKETSERRQVEWTRSKKETVNKANAQSRLNYALSKRHWS